MLVDAITYRQSTKQKKEKKINWIRASLIASSHTMFVGVVIHFVTCAWQTQNTTQRKRFPLISFFYSVRFQHRIKYKQSHQLMNLRTAFIHSTEEKNKQQQQQHKLNYLRPHLLFALRFFFAPRCVAKLFVDCCWWSFYSSNSFALLRPIVYMSLSLCVSVCVCHEIMLRNDLD